METKQVLEKRQERGYEIAIKDVYSQMSSRRSMLLFGIAKEKEYLEDVPHFNTMSKFFNREDITLILHSLIAITSAPLRAVESGFAVDSSGSQQG